MEASKIQDVKHKDFFKRKKDAAQVYIKGNYNRELKAYSCTDTEDMNKEIFIKKDKVVYTGFEY